MPPQPRTSARDPWFDNAKFVLVTLVVVGHSLTLLPKNDTTSWVYHFLYAWHVPAFVLITGYLSRTFSYTRARLRSLVSTVVVPYFFFEALLALFRTQVGGEHLERLWLNPHWPMWYLAALCFWRLATPLFMRLPATVAVALSLAIALVGGAWGGDTLDHLRILGLLPFFVIGLRFTPRQFAWLRRPATRWAGLGSLVLIFVAARFSDLWISTEWLYYRTSYEELGTSFAVGMLTRLAVLAVGLLGCLAALALVPTARGWFTRLGAASLVVYLFHGFAVKGAEYAGIPEWADAQPALSLPVVPLAAAAIACLVAHPAVAGRLSAMVNPLTWIDRKLPTPEPTLVQEARPLPVPTSAGLH